jgi:hypothetical protein
VPETNESPASETNADAGKSDLLSDLLSSGFDSASDLIGYCALHCETPRALFNGKQINDMIRLAGYPSNWVQEVPADEWFSVHQDMLDLCKLARERLAR